MCPKAHIPIFTDSCTEMTSPREHLEPLVPGGRVVRGEVRQPATVVVEQAAAALFFLVACGPCPSGRGVSRRTTSLWFEFACAAVFASNAQRWQEQTETHGSSILAVLSGFFKFQGRRKRSEDRFHGPPCVPGRSFEAFVAAASGEPRLACASQHSIKSRRSRRAVDQ